MLVSYVHIDSHDFELKVGLSTPAASDWPSSQVVKYTYAIRTRFVYILSMLPILPQVLEVSCPRKGYSGTIDSKAGDSSFTSPLSSLNAKMVPWQNLYGIFLNDSAAFFAFQWLKKSFKMKLEHLNLVFLMTWRLQSVQGLLHVNLPHAKDSEIQVSMLSCYELLNRFSWKEWWSLRLFVSIFPHIFPTKFISQSCLKIHPDISRSETRHGRRNVVSVSFRRRKIATPWRCRCETPKSWVIIKQNIYLITLIWISLKWHMESITILLQSIKTFDQSIKHPTFQQHVQHVDRLHLNVYLSSTLRRNLVS